MVPLLQRSEGGEGKRVGFGQAHTSRGSLNERARMRAFHLGYGQLAHTTAPRNPRGAGVPGKRWRACGCYQSQVTSGDEDGGIAAELRPGLSWYDDPGGVIHTGGRPFETVSDSMAHCRPTL